MRLSIVAAALLPTLFAGDPDNLVSRARQSVLAQAASLPDFVCDQSVARFAGQGLHPEWKQTARFDAEILYVSGKRAYANPRRNGKPVKKGSPEDDGVWAMGEFGPVLRLLFAASHDSDFLPRAPGGPGTDSADALAYEVSVPKERSRWAVCGGTPCYAPYSATVWIAPDAAGVRRVEMQTGELPEDHDIASMTIALDYAWVEIGGQRYLLPARGRHTIWFTGSTTALRNDVVFSNYRSPAAGAKP